MSRLYKVCIVFTLPVLFFFCVKGIPVKAQENEQVIRTEQKNLWTDTITVQVGVPVKWYVDVPADADVYSGMGAKRDLNRVGCEYSIKIPSLSMGTDGFTPDGEDGQINLTPGSNLILSFTPEKTGDILFCCWMSSDCHSNLIHVIGGEENTSADRTEETSGKEATGGTTEMDLEKEATDSTTERDSEKKTANTTAEKSTTASEKTQEKSAKAEDAAKATDAVSTSERTGENGKDTSDKDTTSSGNSTSTKSSGQKTSTKGKNTAKNGTAKSNTGNSSKSKSNTTSKKQTLIINHSDLWTGNITVPVGTEIEWYVDVPADADVYGGMGGKPELSRVSCDYSIKIPSLSKGTDSYTADGEAGQINLKPGRNFIAKFTPDKVGDILFCCWMSSACHCNYIHVVESGTVKVSGGSGNASASSKKTEDTKEDQNTIAAGDANAQKESVDTDGEHSENNTVAGTEKEVESAATEDDNTSSTGMEKSGSLRQSLQSGDTSAIWTVLVIQGIVLLVILALQIVIINILLKKKRMPNIYEGIQDNEQTHA